MEIPEDLRYTAEHEWVRSDGPRVRVGITFHAQDALGDVVFVTLPEVGATVTAGQPCGEVESTKSVSDIYAPVTGSITAVNPELEGTPELVNTDPYGQGWMFEVEISEAGVVDTLMSAERYRAQLG
jgi:glycine cleavage system H protein